MNLEKYDLKSINFMKDNYIKSLEIVDDNGEKGYRDPKYPNLILKVN